MTHRELLLEQLRQDAQRRAERVTSRDSPKRDDAPLREALEAMTTLPEETPEPKLPEEP